MTEVSEPGTGLAGSGVKVGKEITPPLGVGLEIGVPGLRVGGRKVSSGILVGILGLAMGATAAGVFSAMTGAERVHELSSTARMKHTDGNLRMGAILPKKPAQWEIAQVWWFFSFGKPGPQRP